MTPRPQIRLFKPHPDNITTRLNLTSSVTLIFIDKPNSTSTITHEPLPTSPYLTTLYNVDISTLLSTEFLTNNATEYNKSTSLVGHTVNNSISHSLNVTMLGKEIFIGIPENQVSTIGLPVTKCKKHLRTHDLPRYLNIKYNKNGERNRCKWALNEKRIGFIHKVYLSCGIAKIRYDSVMCDTNKSKQNKIEPVITETTMRYVPRNVEKIIKNSEDTNEIILLLDHIQWISNVNTIVKRPDDQDDHDEMMVKKIVYNGICNPSLTMAAVECAKKTVEQQCEHNTKWAVVIAKAPNAHAVWTNGLSRSGQPAFDLDALELFVILRSEIFVAQLRPPCDAL